MRTMTIAILFGAVASLNWSFIQRSYGADAKWCSFNSIMGKQPQSKCACDSSAEDMQGAVDISKSRGLEVVEEKGSDGKIVRVKLASMQPPFYTHYFRGMEACKEGRKSLDEAWKKSQQSGQSKYE